MKVCSLPKLLLLLSLFYVSSISVAHAQDDDESEYTREFVWGVNFKTNGGILGLGGVNVKFSRSIGPDTYRTLGFEAVNLKDPKESRITSFSGGSFILGKVNYLYALRFSYGREKVVFKKGAQQGVQVNLLASAGPTIGIVSPYYVEYADGRGNYSYTVPYTPDLNTSSIYGPGRPLEGIGESSIAPGLHLRMGVSFEFGTFKSNVSGLEFGVIGEAYTQRIELLTHAEPNWFFPAAYLTFFPGGNRR